MVSLEDVFRAHLTWHALRLADILTPLRHTVQILFGGHGRACINDVLLRIQADSVHILGLAPE